MHPKPIAKTVQRAAGRLALVAIGLLLATAGARSATEGWQKLRKAQDMRKWAQTRCTILSSETRKTDDGFRLDLSFRYQVGERIYMSTRYGEKPSFTARDADRIEEAQKRFAPGKHFVCYYNPIAPGQSVLVPPPLSEAFLSFLPALLLPVAGILIATLPWLLRAKARRKQEGATLPSPPVRG